MQTAPASATGQRSGLITRWPVMLAALVMGLALGAVAGHYYARKSTTTAPSVTITAEQIAAQDAAVRQSEAESRFLRAQLDTADGEIAVERAARKELETQLRAAQDEIGLVRERLAFFEQLLPPGPEGVVDIRGAEVQRDGQGLKYRVLLMRSGRGDAPFTGALRFQASGVLKGEVVSVDLAPMQIKVETPVGTNAGATEAANPSADKTTSKGNKNSTNDASSRSASDSATGLLPLQFDQYQRTEGVLELPEGFVPETVTISVLEGTTVRASRTVKLAF